MAAILIVDDDKGIRELLHEFFENEHLSQTAATAEDALTRLNEQDYDVIITDLEMPGMSGEDLLRFIRIYQPRTPVIFVTGAIERSRAEGLMAKGAFSYLLKPFHIEDLEMIVNRALEHRQRLLK